MQSPCITMIKVLIQKNMPHKLKKWSGKFYFTFYDYHLFRSLKHLAEKILLKMQKIPLKNNFESMGTSLYKKGIQKIDSR